MMGVAFLKRADQQRYSKLMTSIRDQHSFKKDVYPKSLHEAYELLENHSSSKVGKDQSKDPRRFRNRREGGGRLGGREGRGGRRGKRGRGGRGGVSGLHFAQTTDIVPGSDGRTVARIMCYMCNKHGHYSDFCPEVTEGEQMHMWAYEMVTHDEKGDEDNVEGTVTVEEEHEAEGLNDDSPLK